MKIQNNCICFSHFCLFVGIIWKHNIAASSTDETLTAWINTVLQA